MLHDFLKCPQLFMSKETNVSNNFEPSKNGVSITDDCKPSEQCGKVAKKACIKDSVYCEECLNT